MVFVLYHTYAIIKHWKSAKEASYRSPMENSQAQWWSGRAQIPDEFLPLRRLRECLSYFPGWESESLQSVRHWSGPAEKKQFLCHRRSFEYSSYIQTLQRKWKTHGQFFPGFWKSRAIKRVDEEDNSIDSWEIILPNSPGWENINQLYIIKF